MADGELAAVFKGLAADADQAGGNIAKSMATLTTKTADMEERNVATTLATEEQNARAFTSIHDPAVAGEPGASAAPAGPAAASPGQRARFGTSTSTDYKRTFFTAHPGTEGDVVVHHAVEQQTLRRYPGVVSESEMHSLDNLRGIPKGEINNRVHLSQIRKEWNRFYKANPSPTQDQLLDFATKIDDKFGHLFNPPIR